LVPTHASRDRRILEIHKTNKPDIVVNFFDAAGLAGKDRAEVNLSAVQTKAATISDDDGLIVKRTIDVGNPL
jgi:hypothetical protein